MFAFGSGNGYIGVLIDLVAFCCYGFLASLVAAAQVDAQGPEKERRF